MDRRFGVHLASCRGVAQLASSWVRSTRNFSTSVEQERAFHSTERQLNVSCADAPGLKQAGPPCELSWQLASPRTPQLTFPTESKVVGTFHVPFTKFAEK